MASFSFEDKRMKDLETMSSQVLFWNTITSSKHDIEIIFENSTFDFGTIEINDDIKENENNSIDNNNIVLEGGEGDDEEIKLNFDFLEDNEKTNEEKIENEKNNKKISIKIKNSSSTHKARLLRAFTLPREIESGAKEVFHMLVYSFKCV